MCYDYLHEVETVVFESESSRSVGELQPIFRALGFRLHEDVFSLDRDDTPPPWQHGSIIEVEILSGDSEVFDLDGSWTTLKLKYLFAFLPDSVSADSAMLSKASARH